MNDPTTRDAATNGDDRSHFNRRRSRRVALHEPANEHALRYKQNRADANANRPTTLENDLPSQITVTDSHETVHPWQQRLPNVVASESANGHPLPDNRNHTTTATGNSTHNGSAAGSSLSMSPDEATNHNNLRSHKTALRKLANATGSSLLASPGVVADRHNIVRCHKGVLPEPAGHALPDNQKSAILADDRPRNGPAAIDDFHSETTLPATSENSPTSRVATADGPEVVRANQKMREPANGHGPPGIAPILNWHGEEGLFFQDGSGASLNLSKTRERTTTYSSKLRTRVGGLVSEAASTAALELET